ncbi:MAG: GDP-mannose 4,6-dehydratase [Gammaproteobacteria bacterium]
MTKKLLITGRDGFTGQYLSQALAEKGYDVCGLSRNPKAGTSYSCDLLDKSAVTSVVNQIQPDYVIHLAAISFAAHDDINVIYNVNVLGALNIIDALASLKTPPKRVIVASSAHVYGSQSQSVLDESLCPNPLSHYATSKLAMEFMLRQWFDRLPIVITRPFNYTGPGQDKNFLVPKIVSHFKKQAPTISLGNIDVVREFFDVRSVIDCYCRLLDADNVESQVFNLCSGTGCSVRDIVDCLTSISGHQIQIKQDPALMRSGEMKKLIGSNEKFVKHVGQPLTYSLEETLLNMLNAS